MLNRLKDLLVRAGLSEKEAVFYLFALNNPGQTIPELARLTKLSMATAYRLTESLCELGLFEISEDRLKGRTVKAKSFDNLCKKLDKRIQKLARVCDELNTLLPVFGTSDLASEDLESELPPMETFYGMEDFLTWYFRIAEHKNQRMLGFGSIQRIYDTLGVNYYSPLEQGWIKKSVNNGLMKTVVFTRTPVSMEMKKHDKKDLRLVKFFDDQPMKDDWGCVLDDCAILFFCEDKLNPKVVVAHHLALVDVYKKQFDNMWEKGSL